MKSESIAGKNNWPPYLKAIYDNPNGNKMEQDLFETEKDDNPLDLFATQTGSESPSPPKNVPLKEEVTPFMSSFLPELIHSIKNTLISIKNMSTLSAEKWNEGEFRKYAQQSIAEDIKKIDSVLNSLLNYIHINTPIVKSNTLSIILEEVLEANEKQIGRKGIKIVKKCEKELPETFIHDEQVRFILNSVLQFAILSTPPKGTIGFLVKSFDFHQNNTEKASPERTGGYIEAAIGFMGNQESIETTQKPSPKSKSRNEGTSKLILQLVKEVLQRNHGSMTVEEDPKKPRTLITLKFPIERRKVVYYEPISI